MNNLPKEGSHELSSNWDGEARARGDEIVPTPETVRVVESSSVRPWRSSTSVPPAFE